MDTFKFLIPFVCPSLPPPKERDKLLIFNNIVIAKVSLLGRFRGYKKKGLKYIQPLF